MLKAGNKLYPSATHCYQKYLMIFKIYFVDFFSPSAFFFLFFFKKLKNMKKKKN